MPFAVRLHLAVSLIGLLSLGVYLSPAMDLEADAAGILLGAVMALVAIGMATGWHTRAGGEAADRGRAARDARVRRLARRCSASTSLGLAVFVLLAGAGRWSADHELGRAREPRRADQARRPSGR